MSWLPDEDPRCDVAGLANPVETLVVPRARDIGGFEVRRALPSAKRRMVGPFIFFDQMGPAEFLAGNGLDVQPHPHIGLATVTYLFEGALIHRDSLGSRQEIAPGAVNWMTAGRGIVHSERSGQEVRNTGGPLFGIQSWVALPASQEETAPSFVHHPREALPTVADAGTRVRVIAGSLYGAAAPVPVAGDMVYADVAMDCGARLPVPAEHEERALYAVSGRIELGGVTHEPMQLLVLRPGDEVTVTAVDPARLLIFGGAPMDGPRHIWWNFVSSSKERIEQAKADWQAGRFPPVPGDPEFVPLPEG